MINTIQSVQFMRKQDKVIREKYLQRYNDVESTAQSLKASKKESLTEKSKSYNTFYKS